MMSQKRGAGFRMGIFIIKLIAKSALSNPGAFWRGGKLLYSLHTRLKEQASSCPRKKLDLNMKILDELLRYRRSHPHDIATFLTLLEQLNSQYRHDPKAREALYTLFSQEAQS